MADVTSAIQGLFSAIVEKRVTDILAYYADSPATYVFVEGPRWSTLGIKNISEGWRAFVNAPLAVQSCTWVEGPFSQVADDMAWLAGIVELTVQVRDRVQTLRLRGTFVLRRAREDSWSIVHEHFSLPASDPYGIGDWLEHDRATAS
ncbi:MAG TPA: nuclear transport factor 2 family protein [Ktedonobacteraceae bacterium]|nr:nuclear transport factor 2 family protein [Ktedonobacteraceae bacterium]